MPVGGNNKDDSPTAKYLPFVLWLVPVIFGAGGTIAALSNVSEETKRTTRKLEAQIEAAQSSDRRVQALESEMAAQQKALDAHAREINSLEREVKSLELDVAVLCRSVRGARCTR